VGGLCVGTAAALTLFTFDAVEGRRLHYLTRLPCLGNWQQSAAVWMTHQRGAGAPLQLEGVMVLNPVYSSSLPGSSVPQVNTDKKKGSTRKDFKLNELIEASVPRYACASKAAAHGCALDLVQMHCTHWHECLRAAVRAQGAHTGTAAQHLLHQQMGVSALSLCAELPGRRVLALLCQLRALLRHRLRCGGGAVQCSG